ncbi:transcription initiation factor IIE subunit beta [Ephemerocybe angulata]|uniref:Transcription initiation factor IIE subunit beta n=1 Tax=Ephemerocybe angulata TaxID=980116 RepID=A0A8H6I9X0_9AGAR|nr:transcription initiation factor IIE subunit beta [Tulosesus angulatus]
MSKLQQDAAAFKNVMHRQDFTSWHSKNGKPAAAAPPSPKKKNRQKSSVVFSQPKDTGTGTNINTQLVYAVDYMRQKPGPMRLEDIALFTDTPLDTDLMLREKFKAHDKIQFDHKTGLYSYKHDFTFRNKAALLTEIQRSTKRGGGLSVRALKESWKEAPQAIEELEKEGEVLVTRTTKDGQLRMVFWNEIKPTDEAGGKRVDQEFLDLWHGLKVPAEVDLKRELASGTRDFLSSRFTHGASANCYAEGLQLTSAEAAPQKAPGKKKGKKGGQPRQRQVRITNTHLRGEIDLSKDYVAPGK